jgi:hypothetical protein
MNTNPENYLIVEEDILIYAFRYSITRGMFASLAVTNNIRNNITKLRYQTLLLIQKEIIKEIIIKNNIDNSILEADVITLDKLHDIIQAEITRREIEAIEQ